MSRRATGTARRTGRRAAVTPAGALAVVTAVVVASTGITACRPASADDPPGRRLPADGRPAEPAWSAQPTSAVPAPD